MELTKEDERYLKVENRITALEDIAHDLKERVEVLEHDNKELRGTLCDEGHEWKQSKMFDGEYCIHCEEERHY